MKVDAAEAPATTYNFHDLFRVRVRHRGVDALMQEEFERFQVPGGPVDLTVEEGAVDPAERLLFEGYSYDDRRFVVDLPGGRVEVAEDRIRAEPGCHPPYLFALWVEGLMKRCIAERGAVFVHASAVARDGVGILLPAWMHTGKTDLALNFMAHGYDYMADDWCFVLASGEILAYPRWMSLFSYHFDGRPGLLDAVPKEERADLRRRLAVTRFAESIRGSNVISRNLRRYLTDRFYVYERAPPTDLVDGAGFRMRAPLTTACLLVSDRNSDGGISPLSPNELARNVILCGNYERRLFDAHRVALAYAGHRWALDDVTNREVEVVKEAVSDAQCLQLSVPPKTGPEDLNRLRRAIEGA